LDAVGAGGFVASAFGLLDGVDFAEEAAGFFSAGAGSTACAFTRLLAFG